MTQITSKPFMTRLCLMFFILLCSVFTSENAFSMNSMKWKDTFKEAILKQKEQTITFTVSSYFFNLDVNTIYNYFGRLSIEYSEDGKVFTPIFRAGVVFNYKVEPVLVKILFEKEGETFTYPKGKLIKESPDLFIGMPLEILDYRNDRGKIVQGRQAFFKVQWKIPRSIKTIKAVSITGQWNENVNNKVHGDSFYEVFKMKYQRPKQKAPQESNNNLKVTGKADVVSVTGVNSGETIKVYNAFTNVEVKSVIAHDNVVNIRLPKGKVYLIQVGSKSTKVAL